MTNGTGSNANRAEDFWFFDRMPKAYRDLLNYTTLPISAESVKSQFLRIYDADEAWPAVHASIRNVERTHCRATWGKDHPYLAENAKSV